MTTHAARRVVRIGLVVLALGSIPLGLWASVAPRGFFDTFPGAGLRWTALDGPYNEHLVRDFGAYNLALGLVTAWAAWSRRRAAAIAVAVAWLVLEIPHLTYHLRHTGTYEDDTAKLTSLVSLASLVVVPVVVLWATRSLDRDDPLPAGATARD